MLGALLDRHRPARGRIARTPIAWCLLPLVALSACAHVEKDAYGIRNFSVEGMEELGEASLKRCLLTTGRPRVGITLGLPPSACGQPPFERDAPRLSLWRWPWTDFQTYNPAVLDQDLERLIRWYKARGFYDAEIVEVRTDPPHAKEYSPPTEGQCDPEHEECPVDLVVVVDEGMPLHVGSLEVVGKDALEPMARAMIEQAQVPATGERFDEHFYEVGKQSLVDQLAEAGHPGATVRGKVRLDHRAKRAHIRYELSPGPVYRFGRVFIEGQGTLPEAPIRAAADVPEGERYRQSMLREAQLEVHALGAFTAVEVERELHEKERRADIRIVTTPLTPNAWRLGVGVMSGALQRTETGEMQSVPQWDLHLLGRYERRHVFNTLGRLRIEDRPRMIFDDRFPGLVSHPKPGNVIKVRLNQPGLVEKRTDLIFETLYDYGPDPYLGFDRHDILGRISLKRGFLARRLFVTLTVQQDFFVVPAGESTSDGSQIPSSYGYSFLEQDIALDLRDDAIQPRKGVYLGMLASEGLRWALSDWTAFRLAPEARGYIPLPFAMVFAARFAVAAMFITDASDSVDATSQRLGPNAYRLRGGGPNSNRGFISGQLGAGPTGGLRRWESTAELRIRLGESFGLAGFADVGDVNSEPSFRFDKPQPSVGFGLRYLTPLGPIRFDVGFRVGAIGEDENLMPLLKVPGAWHLTIGESF